MKKISAVIVLMASVLGSVWCAQYDRSTHIYSQDIYRSFELGSIHEPLARLPYLLRDQLIAKNEGRTLSEEKQAQLQAYTEQVKGVKVLLIGFPACRPCLALFRHLDEEVDGQCLIEYWDKQGVEFYMLNTIEENKNSRREDNLLFIWNIRALPVLLVLKDGMPVARLNGYNESQSEEIIEVLKQQVNKARK